jgi:catechol 2,3-dioxygenase-like lactoylglutathione lyase family enzyme
MRLNHVALTVADAERSAAFYARHFGLTNRIHDDGHLLIVGPPDGSALLALSEGAAPAAGLPRTNHFGFQAAITAEVREARERFSQAGLIETEWQDAPGMVRVQIADPDGYRVDLFAF